MARGKWTKEHTEIVKDLINKEKPFTVSQLSKEFGVSIASVRRNVKIISEKLGEPLQNLYCSDMNVPVIKKSIQVQVQKDKKDTSNEIVVKKSLQTYMCRCKFANTDPIWVKVSAKNEEDAIVKLKANYKTLESIHNILTKEEYNKARKTHGTMRSNVFSTNSIRYYAGKTRNPY